MSVLITEVKIIHPGSTHNGKKKNILIKNGKIDYIGSDRPNAKTIIEGAGCLLSAGWFDLRANFCDPGLEHKEDIESGSRAAMAGGFTEVAILPNTQPVIQSKNDVRYVSRLNTNSLVQIRPLAAITKGCAGEELTEMLDMHAAGAAAFTDGTSPIWNTDILLKSLLYVQKFDGLIIDQPQDKWLSQFGTMNEGVTSTLLGLKGIPNLAEDIAVSRDLDVLTYSGGRLHLANVSTKGAVELIRKAKKSGLDVTCDVAAYHLIFTEDEVGDFESIYKVNPPLRSEKDVKALLKGLKDGTIDAIVSSHEPQDIESKKLEFDNAEFGMSSIQTVLNCLNELTDEISLEELIPKLTLAPRKILKLDPVEISEGAIANLTLIDPKAEWEYNATTNHSKSESSPFYGKKMKGRVIAVFNNGQQWLAN